MTNADYSPYQLCNLINHIEPTYIYIYTINHLSAYRYNMWSIYPDFHIFNYLPPIYLRDLHIYIYIYIFIYHLQCRPTCALSTAQRRRRAARPLADLLPMAPIRRFLGKTFWDRPKMWEWSTLMYSIQCRTMMYEKK